MHNLAWQQGYQRGDSVDSSGSSRGPSGDDDDGVQLHGSRWSVAAVRRSRSASPRSAIMEHRRAGYATPPPNKTPSKMPKVASVAEMVDRPGCHDWTHHQDKFNISNTAMSWDSISSRDYIGWVLPQSVWSHTDLYYLTNSISPCWIRKKASPFVIWEFSGAVTHSNNERLMIQESTRKSERRLTCTTCFSNS